MIRLAVILAVAVIVLGLAGVIGAAGSRIVRTVFRTPRRRSPDPAGYEWERRTDQLYRRLKAVSGPQEDREEMMRFIQTRRGVDAYVEPRTVIHPLSVVLVAEDGEWVRYQLKDDFFIRELSRIRSIRVYDAAKVGYPERMRRYRRSRDPDQAEGTAGQPGGSPDQG